MTSANQASLLGNIHGGEIMKLAMDQLAFLEPVRVGGIVPIQT